MALRNLVARMRTPAAAALRLRPPAPRVSPPRPRFYGSAQNGKHRKGIDLESASIEEIRRQADLVGKEIDEALERTKEEVPVIWKDIWGTVRLWLVAGAGIELMLFLDSCLRPRPEVEALSLCLALCQTTSYAVDVSYLLRWGFVLEDLSN